MTKKLLVYIPYDFSDISKGSSVRPYFLTNALKKKMGKNVFVISGGAESRKKLLVEFKNNKFSKGEWALYMESSNWHLLLVDYMFIFWSLINIKSRGIFIRDIYCFFPKEYPPINLKTRFVYIWMKLDYFIYIRFFKLFVPGKRFGEAMPWVNLREKYLLPPAGRLLDTDASKRNRNELIYVGGIAKDTGHDILVEAFKIAVKFNTRLRLKMVCNFRTELIKVEKHPRIETLTGLNNSQVQAICLKSGIGVIPRKRTAYHDIAIPVKLFDFMTFGLPVLATNCDETKSFIKNGNFGLVCDDNPNSLAKAMLKMTSSSALEIYRQNIKKSIKLENSWDSRAEKILITLGLESRQS